ncbi:MAG: outer membrane protein insertion porin family, partial [Candidatus Marinamargulisbacteria bacterium]
GDPLVLMVGEGVIDDIVITGNNKTKDYVILREIDLRPGSLIQQESLRQNLRRVFNLNYFTDIQPQFLPGKSPNTYKLKMDITERQTNGSFTFGGGYSPTGGFSVFSDLFWDNLFGTGQLIMLKGQFGRNTTYQFKYHNPWMWDKRKSLTMRTWLTYGELGSYNPLVSQISFRNERRKGVDVSLGVPFSYDLISSHRLKYESVEIPGSDIDYRIHSYTFNISDDTRDVRFNPSDGHYYSYALEQSVKWLDNSLLFTRQDISLKEFLPTVENQTIAIRAEIGYLSSPEIRNQDIFRSEWYIIGGGSTVRGYDDQYPFSFGNKRILGTIEYRFLFTDTFQTVLFIDAGNATNDSIFDIREYKIGKGFGIRMNVPPLGPLRLDLGMDEDETIRIHFNIGHAF